MAAALAKARFESAMHSLPPKVQKFFNTHLKKGENFELKTELNSEYRERRKEAVKRVIANMTVGKDVSGLFTDVLKCMQTDDLELKKLVYLYLMNYAKSQPELVILAVNSFVKDSEDPNPLIRALAVRTMGCLRAEKIVDYLTDPLRKALRDSDPYVRKTAAICVAKLFDLKPQLTIDNGFITQLQDLLSDSNPMVVANSIAALRDIQTQGHGQGSRVFELNPVILHKLLAALNECTEWGQICILETLSEYTPHDTTEIQLILDRVVPRLSHINTAVVLAAIRVLLVYMDYDTTILNSPSVLKKLTTSLVSLVSSSASSSLMYVALRNIQLILQKRPDLFQPDLRLFFCQYNDPLFVKLEKLKLLLFLSKTEASIDPVLQELKEYVNEVDVTFVKKVVLAMGQLALQLPMASDRCMQALIEVAHLRVLHSSQMCFLAFKDILRQYPTKFDALVGQFLNAMEPMELDLEECQCAFLWLLSTCYSFFNNQVLESHLQPYCTTFLEARPSVQCQLMTTIVQCYLHAPSTYQPLLHHLLQKATMETDHPDVRDRAFIYWRLLSHANALTTVIPLPSSSTTTTMGESSQLSWTSDHVLPSPLVHALVRHLGTLASVSHTLPKEQSNGVNSTVGPLGGGGGDPTSLGSYARSDEDEDEDAWIIALPKDQGQGIELQVSFAPTPTRLYFQLTNHHGSDSLTEFAVQFNVNTLGLTPVPSTDPIHIAPQSQLVIPILLQVQQAMLKPMDPLNVLQIAVKTNIAGILYFSVFLPDTWMETGACLI